MAAAFSKVLLTFLLGLILGFFLSMTLNTIYEVFKLKSQTKKERGGAFLLPLQETLKLNDVKEYIFIKGKPRLLCYLLVGPTSHSKALHVKRTWGKRCDRLLFFSTESNSLLDPIVLNVTEGYSFLWEKSKQALHYLHDNYLDDFEWYLKADDDTFVIVENLKLFLEEKEASDPVYYGVKFKAIVKQGYMSGGGGYVFSREALTRLNERGFKTNDSSLCPHHLSIGAEDVSLGKCFESVGVRAGDSFDSKGRPRFFSHSPMALFYKGDFINHSHWYWRYLDHPHSLGPGCCSDYMISFHNIPPRMMWTLEMLLYQIKINYEENERLR